MKTDRPIIFHEPGILFAEFDPKTYVTPDTPLTEGDLEIKKGVDKILSAAEGALRRLKDFQDSCDHPVVRNDITNNTHQCMICGKRSFKKAFK